MDARSYFLSLHRYTHAEQPGTLAGDILATAPEEMRLVRPGHNSIAWLIWHIARGEDWGVNAMVAERRRGAGRGRLECADGHLAPATGLRKLPVGRARSN
jgi:hypothetical protein